MENQSPSRNSDDGHQAQPAQPSGPPAEVLSPDQLREQLKLRLEPQLFEQLDHQMTRMSMWRSVWPPADCLHGYSLEERAEIMASVKARTEADIESARRSQNRQDRAQWMGFGTAMSSVIGGSAIAIFGSGWWAAPIGVALVLAGIGGPSVARILADRKYLQHLKQHQDH